MPSYRFEIAKQGRAVCKSSECKKQNVKIGKGELRFGTFVTSGQFESWSWKHWGCVTPVQLENVVAALDGYETFEADTNVLDGYEDLDEESQVKVRTALQEGHVPDEDWRGDPECNRAGAKGMRNRTPKKKKQENDTEDDEAPEADASPTKAKVEKPAKGKKARVTKTESEATPDVSPVPEKKASRKRKAPEEAKDDAPAPKSRGRKPKPRAPEEEAPPAEATSATKKRGRKPKPATNGHQESSENQVEDTVEAKATTKKSRAKTANSKGGAGDKHDDDVAASTKSGKKADDVKSTEKPARGRPKKAAKVVQVEDEAEVGAKVADQETEKKKVKGAGSKRAKKNA